MKQQGGTKCSHERRRKAGEGLIPSPTSGAVWNLVPKPLDPLIWAVTLECFVPRYKQPAAKRDRASENRKRIKRTFRYFPFFGRAFQLWGSAGHRSLASALTPPLAKTSG